MRKIHKFPLARDEEQRIPVPSSFEFRFVGLDPHGTLCIWGEVGDSMTRGLEEQANTFIRIFIVGTGQSIPANAHRYLGSVVDRTHVWHVYTL